LQFALFAVCTFETAKCKYCKVHILLHMNSQYRFSLQKGGGSKKTSCPKCGGRKCFTRYVDNEGQYTFPDEVGICDRINNCGYHYSPKDYFSEHPDAKDCLLERDKTLQPNVATTPIVVETSFIDRDVMERTLCSYARNPLFVYLSRVIGKSVAEQLFKTYNVGTANAWGGSTVFWQVDIDGHVRTGKVMLYNPDTGHRVKQPMARVGWAHSLMRIENFNLRQCYFGEHLLRQRPNDKVMIVESEKTAIVAAHFIPQYVWLATGGLHNLRASDALSNREVLLLPDLKAEDKWREKLSTLGAICRSVAMSELLNDIATSEQRDAGLDIADFLLMEETAEMILARMIDRNPHLQTLIDKLQLTLIGRSDNDCLQSEEKDL
jgi:hypothetical protein